MQIVLLDQTEIATQLLPFTYTRPISEIRVGIMTLAEKWAHFLGEKPSYATSQHLQEKYPNQISGDNLFLASNTVANADLASAAKVLKNNEALVADGQLLAARCSEDKVEALKNNGLSGFQQISYEGSVISIEHPWHIFQHNGACIRADFALLTKGKKSEEIIDPYTRVYNPAQVFVSEGVDIKAAILNAEAGPIYIGKGAVIQEGAIIKGPFALGESSYVNMGAKIKGDVTIGPHCKVGGEVSNSVFFGYSNKGHDGFLGNSVIGEWCNLGADTNASNLKNNYANVKVWSYGKNKFVDTGLQFCGLLMGDHSKSGINTMFNTGTVVGVNANIFGDGFPRTLIPSFAWGGAAGFSTFKLDKAEEVAKAVMARRNLELSAVDQRLLEHVFNATAQYRTWEKK
jgi:UDP-N-acetylglucosamine diphosphorylase/glucosamine-1-phosphate N-acetyltransferase